MFRKLAAVLAFTFTLGVIAGCGSSSSSAPSAPITTKQGVDKKGNKTKQMEASFEDPPKK